jgi:hypothetical protein
MAQCLGCTQDNLSRTNPADANNLIDIAARCLLIEDGDRLILIDTEWEAIREIFGYYSLWGDNG